MNIDLISEEKNISLEDTSINVNLEESNIDVNLENNPINVSISDKDLINIELNKIDFANFNHDSLDNLNYESSGHTGFQKELIPGDNISIIDNIISSADPYWGNISGELTDQLDLTIALNSKANSTDLINHTSDTSIHFTQGDISITESQISDFGSYIPTTEKAANNGVATLDAGGKIPANQLPSSVMEYKGTWNASTNTPTLSDGVGDAGDVYLCNVSGTQNLGSGNITFSSGDWVVYNGTIWEKSINSNSVISVNEQTGTVSLTQDHIPNGNTYVQTENNFSDIYKSKVETINNGESVGELSYWNGTSWIPILSPDIYYDYLNKRFSIRTTNASKTFNIYGNVNFTIQDSSGTIASLANDGAGNLGNGEYRYAIVFVTDEGETGGYSTDRSNVVTITDNTVNGKVRLTNIPTGNSYTIARKIYRTVVNGNQSLLYYLDTINDNTTTEYLDNVADSGLTTSDGWYRKPDETTGRFYLNNKKSLETGEFNTFMGNSAGSSITSGHSSTFIGAQAGRDTTTGNSNNFIGYSSGVTITAGSGNNFMGYASGYYLRNCSYNTAIGDTALRAATIKDGVHYNTCLGPQTLYSYNYPISHNIAIGYRAGRGIAQSGSAYYNILIGNYTAYNTLDNGSSNILIGYDIHTPTTSTSNHLNIGNLITGNMSGTKYVDIDGSLTTSQYKLSALNTAPSSATDTGTTGEIRITSDFIYVCIDTDTWVRSPLSTW